MKAAVLAGVFCLGVGVVAGQGLRGASAARVPARQAALQGSISSRHVSSMAGAARYERPELARGLASCPTGQLRPAGPTGIKVLDGVSVTFSPARAIGAQPGDLLKPGYIFQVIHVTIRDFGKAAYQYSAYDFAALNGNAQGYAVTANDANLAEPITSGILRPGNIVSGDLAYELPLQQRPAAVLWSPAQIGHDTPLSQIVFLSR